VNGICDQRLLHAVARFALPQADHGGVDGNDQHAVASGLGAMYCVFGGGASAGEIQLKPHGTGGACFHVFEAVSGNSGEDAGGAGFPGSACRGHFAVGMHDAAVTDGREENGH
jgi:hypothetical protein